MPDQQDLAHLTRRLSSSYQPSGAQPYSLEVSFQTVLEAEQRIYGICELRGIVLQEDALPLQENILPLREEREMQPELQKRSYFLPSVLGATCFSLAGVLGGFYLRHTLIETGRVQEAIPEAAAVLIVGELLGLGWMTIGAIAQNMENKKWNSYQYIA